MSRNWLPFLLRGSPVVGVRIGPGRHNALLDTGASISMIAPSVVIRLGMQTSGLRSIVGVTGGPRSVPTVEVASVGVGNITLAPFTAAVLEVTQLGLPIDMILRTDAFAGHRLQFDFANGRVYVLD